MRVNNWTFFIQSLLFPNHCALCGSTLDDQTDFCPGCHADLPFNRQACPTCALPVAGIGGLPCGRCSRRPPPFATSQVPLRYASPFNRLIGEFKFQHKLHLAGLLSRLFCDQLPSTLALPDLIVPIPLHPRRLRERGFNQSLELARGVAAELNLKIDRRSCRRIRATPPQSGLDKTARSKNLRAAFVADSSLSGRHIALFDDVITTGATVTAASQALLRAGASRVDVWALARTSLP